MFDHLLAPLRATAPAGSISEAVELYCALRERRERELGVAVSRDLGQVVRARLSAVGVV